MRIFIVLLIAFSFSCIGYADTATDARIKALDEKIAYLDEGLHKIEKDLSDVYTKLNSCTLTAEYYGRFMGYCPEGFVSEVSESNFGTNNFLWVTCYYYKLVCL